MRSRKDDILGEVKHKTYLSDVESCEPAYVYAAMEQYAQEQTDLLEKRAETAEHCLNQIQDLLEYEYVGFELEELRDIILLYVNQYTEEMQNEI